MGNVITDEDINMLFLKKIMYCKIDLVTKNIYKTVYSSEGSIISGNYNFNADSDIRRTAKIDVCLKDCNIDFNDDIYFNYNAKISIGYYSYISKKIIYYNMGIYMFDKSSTTYDAQTNTISLDLADMCALMDNEHMGTQYGALTPCIYAVDPDTGKRYDINEYPNRMILKNIVIGLIKEFGISKYRIEDIGIHNRKDTDEYKWNELPYDLEFSIGAGLLEILSAIKNLYTNYEFFFDREGNFIFQEKSCNEEDPIIVDETITNRLVISQSNDRTTYDIKNVIEVWGKNYNLKSCNGRFIDTDSNTYANGTYQLMIGDYGEDGYSDSLTLAIKVKESNSSAITYISINNLPSKQIYDSISGESILSDTLVKDSTYMFKYSATKGGFYYLGSYQIHAVAILTNGLMNNNYSNIQERFKYFSKKFNTTSISFIVDKNNPYCIEKKGLIVKMLEGDKYSNLESNSLALDYAEHKLNRLSKRITSLTLEMIAIPWLEVNQKIKYIPLGETEAKTYVIQSISGDLMSDKMQINITDFTTDLDDE